MCRSKKIMCFGCIPIALFHLRRKKKEEFCFKVTLWLVGLLAAAGIAASRWPRF